jgi:hypothetical protein
MEPEALLEMAGHNHLEQQELPTQAVVVVAGLQATQLAVLEALES